MKYSLRSLLTFSIRDLLWLTVVVALAVGWWVDHQRIANLERERDEAVNDAKILRDSRVIS